MLSRMCAWFLPGLWLLAPGAACKARESAGQDSRPLPTPEPPASPSATPLREDAAATPKKRPLDDDSKEPAAKPKRSAEAPATAAAPPASASSANAPATAAGGGSSTAAPALPSAPVFTAPSAACLTRCQGAMQGCLSAPVDGGVPGFGNLDLCKKAFEACQAACK
jgi:hypothetical protein